MAEPWPLHLCPKNGCITRVPVGMLACRPHWRLIPAPLRRAVWNTWRNGAGAGTPAHDAAIRAAIRALNGCGDG